MFLPVSCDATLYHWPFATVGLIVLNFAAFIAMQAGLIDPLNGWVLMYGDGVVPRQWLLSLFVHEGLGHLLGNMFFMWVFGMVTEGKLGWWRFLACYFLIGIGQSAIEQVVMLGATPGQGSMGASAAISGLMAMACIWAPMNEVKMLIFVFYFFFSVDVTILTLAVLFIGLEVGWAALIGFFAWSTTLPFEPMAWSSALHLMGAAIGAILGTVLLVRKQVDCERWDLFTVIRGEQGEPTKEELAPPSTEKIAAHRHQQAHEAKQKILAYLHVKQAPLALQLLRKVRDMQLPVELDRQEQIKLIAGLDKHKKWADAAPMMAKYLEEFPEGSEAVRLRLAQICLMELELPSRALELLEPLKSSPLSEKQSELRKKMIAIAKKQVAEGAVELDDVL